MIETHDRDFLVRHSEGVPHAGICYCHQQNRTISEILDILLVLNECLEPEDMQGQLELWAAVTKPPLHRAAIDLCRVLGREVP